MIADPPPPRVYHADRLPRDASAENTVYVGPPGPRAPKDIPVATVFAEPFSRRRRPARQRVQAYRAYLENAPYLKSLARRRLRGMNLACLCAPVPCHADVLLEVANRDPPENRLEDERPSKRRRGDDPGGWGPPKKDAAV